MTAEKVGSMLPCWDQFCFRQWGIKGFKHGAGIAALNLIGSLKLRKAG
jgi:hypothetical protein